MNKLWVGCFFIIVIAVAIGSPGLVAQTRWADDVRITDLEQDVGSPKLAALEDGTLYVACSLEGVSNAALYKSDDGGGSWTLDRYIVSNDTVTPISIVAVEGSSPGGEKLFVSLRAGSGSSHELRVWWLDVTTGSTGYGVVATGTMSNQISGGTLCVDDQDYPDNWRIYIAYEVFDSSLVNASFRFALSADQGMTWTNNTYVGSVEGGSAGIDIAYGHGAIYYVYGFSWQFSPPEIRIRISWDRGVSWGSYQTVETLGAASLYSTIVAASSESTVAVCFDDGIEEDLAVRVSYDAGFSWTTADPPNDPSVRELYPQLALSNQDEKLALAWLHNDASDKQIMVSECALSSPTMWTTAESIVDGGGDPSVGPPSMVIDAARDDATCVAWSDLRVDPITTAWFDSQAPVAVWALDQYQDGVEYGFWFESSVVRWQEFWPTLNILTAVDVYIQRLGNPGNIVLEVRTQDEALLGEGRVLEEDVQASGWVRVEFSPAIALDTSTIYRIYIATDEPSPDSTNRYFWKGSTDSDYNPACSCSVQEGNQWPTFDFAFQTWGYNDSGVVATPPEEFDHSLLHANWPNPFNPRTTISFELRDATPFSLNVYDLSGRLVKVLARERAESAGRYELHWDGRNQRGQLVPSGVYLYRLKAGSFEETKRMVLVR